MRIGSISKWFYYDCGWCRKCQTTWNFVTKHVTGFSDGKACFPLCEQCWGELIIEQRLPYYEDLIDEWHEGGAQRDVTWTVVEKAVRDGK